jgi:hypothetical protein
LTSVQVSDGEDETVIAPSPSTSSVVKANNVEPAAVATVTDAFVLSLLRAVNCHVRICRFCVPPNPAVAHVPPDRIFAVDAEAQVIANTLVPSTLVAEVDAVTNAETFESMYQPVPSASSKDP